MSDASFFYYFISKILIINFKYDITHQQRKGGNNININTDIKKFEKYLKRLILLKKTYNIGYKIKKKKRKQYIKILKISKKY